MAEAERPAPLLRAGEIEARAEAEIHHPLNPHSEVHVRPLSDWAGLQRARLSLARVPPGKESFIYHAHEADEEFLYILSGRGRAEIGDEVIEVGPGDFMGFATPSIGHHLTNPYDQDLVYLMGGERSRAEIGTFPRAGKRIIFGHSGFFQVDEKDLTPMSFDDWLAKPTKDGDES